MIENREKFDIKSVSEYQNMKIRDVYIFIDFHGLNDKTKVDNVVLPFKELTPWIKKHPDYLIDSINLEQEFSKHRLRKMRKQDLIICLSSPISKQDTVGVK